VKVVPGASADEIVGPHGDRIRVRVSAPPEGGRANRAVTTLLATRLHVPPASVLLAAGASSARKAFVVEGLSPAEALRRLEAP
jgi:uncharacterized protein YggU (UPF0235/DUF167 family)